MHIYITTVVFILGLVIASFLNALLYRIDNGYKYPDIYIKGSHCEKCGKQLIWYELIPVLSFFIFNGKCRQCGYKVPVYYPISEFVLGLSFASLYYFSFSPLLFVVVVFLFIMSYFDILYKGIPKNIVHVFLVFSLVSFVINTLLENKIPDNGILISTIFVAGTYALTKIMKKPFGVGDLLVLFGLGFVLPMNMFMSLLYIFLFVSLIYAAFLMLRKKATLKSSLPLLPIMYISFALVLLFNQYLVIILERIFLL